MHDAVHGTIIGTIIGWPGDMRGPQEGAEIAIETKQKAEIWSQMYHRWSVSATGIGISSLSCCLASRLIISIAPWGRNINAKPFLDTASITVAHSKSGSAACCEGGACISAESTPSTCSLGLHESRFLVQAFSAQIVSQLRHRLDTGQ